MTLGLSISQLGKIVLLINYDIHIFFLRGVEPPRSFSLYLNAYTALRKLHETSSLSTYFFHVFRKQQFKNTRGKAYWTERHVLKQKTFK